MMLVVTLLCRNEEDIIASTINFYLSQGADKIVITDNASIDGTRLILRNFENDHRILVIDEMSYTHDQSKWVTRMNEIATNDLRADWIIHSDADEFWLPNYGCLKDFLSTLPFDCKAISVRRSNFLPPCLSSSSNIPFFESMTLRERRSLNSLGRELPPKVCHRSLPSITVDDGNHAVRQNNIAIPAPMHTDIKIFHYPVRSFRQFEQKIRLGSIAIENNPRIRDTGVGCTWRYLYHDYLLEGRLFEYYKSLRPEPDRLATLVSNGDLIFDTRLRDQLRLYSLSF
jgi:hypothetical protein